MSVIFFFFNQRTSIAVVKKKDPPCCSPNQGLAISDQLSWAFQKHQEESRWRILTEGPGDGAPGGQPPLTHANTRMHTGKVGEGPGPKPQARAPTTPASQGRLISSEINHAEGWEPHKSFKQTRKSNSTIYPARASSSVQGMGGARQQNRPCPMGSTFALGPCGEETCGHPCIPCFLCCWPLQE